MEAKQTDVASEVESVPSEAPPATATPAAAAPWAHTDFPPLDRPVKTVYCGVCGMCPDFCEFGERWDECKVWIRKNCPELYDEAMLADGPPTEGGEKEAAPVVKKKKKVQVRREVFIQIESRGRRKYSTMVFGLDLYDVKLDEASKKFKKQFACGCAVKKGNPGSPDFIEIQGDVGDDLPDVIMKHYKQVDEDEFKIKRKD